MPSNAKAICVGYKYTYVQYIAHTERRSSTSFVLRLAYYIEDRRMAALRAMVLREYSS